jgi:RND family efflux transporter MFP subunit
VQSAQAAYDQVSWKPGIEATSASKNLQSATIDYEIAKATYDEAARAADNYKIELQIQQKSYELAQLRHQQLVNSLDKTVTDATKAAQAKLDTYQLNLSIMEKDYELAQLKQSYLEAGVDPNIEKAVQQAQLSVDKLQTDVDKGRLVAPFDGVISSMALTEGRAVDAYKNVAVISNMDQLELAAQLSDSEMSTLEVSMTVTVTLGTYPGRVFTGIISEMPYPYAKGGSTAKLDTADQFTHVTLDDKTVQLRQGDVATVSVLLEQAENTLWLPPAAIRSFEGRNFVVVEQDGRQARVDIKVGIVGKERIEVLSGVEEGQTIIGQ